MNSDKELHDIIIDRATQIMLIMRFANIPRGNITQAALRVLARMDEIFPSSREVESTDFVSFFKKFSKQVDQEIEFVIRDMHR